MSVDQIKQRRTGGEVTKAFGMGAIHPYPTLERIGQRVRGIFSFFGLKLIIVKPEK